GGRGGGGGLFQGGGVGLQEAGGGVDARFDAVHGQVPADDAGGGDEHLLGPAADRLGGDGGHAPRVGQAARPGAGVGVAGADDDAAGVARRQPLATKAHRGGDDAVLGEDAGRSRRGVAD